MMQMSLLVFTCAVLILVSVRGQPCTKNSDCGDNQCCQILRPDFKISQVPVDLPDWVQVNTVPPNATCQGYKSPGQSCKVFEKSYGFCGCAPGLDCSYRPSQKRATRSLSDGEEATFDFKRSPADDLDLAKRFPTWRMQCNQPITHL